MQDRDKREMNVNSYRVGSLYNWDHSKYEFAPSHIQGGLVWQALQIMYKMTISA